jgi:hypothetical protein
MGAKTMNTVNWQTYEYYQGAQDQMVPQIVGMLPGHGLQTGSYSNLTAVEVNRDAEEFVRYAYPDSDLGIVVLAATGHGPVQVSASAFRDALNSILNQSNAVLIMANAAIEPDSLATVPHSFSLDEALQELEDIRDEVDETCAGADDVRPIPESAYDYARLFLQWIHHEIPKLDIMWSEDGGIGLEWRPREGIATMTNETLENESRSQETQETDPLLALAGTLKYEVTDIDAPMPPAIRPTDVDLTQDAQDIDPLLALAGTLKCEVTDIGERHDDYIGDALLAELREDKDE